VYKPGTAPNKRYPISWKIRPDNHFVNVGIYKFIITSKFKAIEYIFGNVDFIRDTHYGVPPLI